MQNAVELVTPLTLEECRRLLRCQLDRPFPFSRGKRCCKCLDFCTTTADAHRLISASTGGSAPTRSPSAAPRRGNRHEARKRHENAKQDRQI